MKMTKSARQDHDQYCSSENRYQDKMQVITVTVVNVFSNYLVMASNTGKVFVKVLVAF